MTVKLLLMVNYLDTIKRPAKRFYLQMSIYGNNIAKKRSCTDKTIQLLNSTLIIGLPFTNAIFSETDIKNFQKKFIMCTKESCNRPSAAPCLSAKQRDCLSTRMGCRHPQAVVPPRVEIGVRRCRP